MNIEKKLAERGLALSDAPAPIASYVPAIRTGNLVFISGQLPLTGGQLLAKGSVPSEVTVDQAQEAAAQCVLNGLAALKAALGDDLSSLKRVIRVGVFVQSDDNFTNQALVANGASDLLESILGDDGKHVRAAVGVNSLPKDATVEIEFTFEVS